MKIQYLGHSSFLLTFGDGVRIVTDPFGDVGIPMPHVCADAVTVSHSHYDHCNIGAVKASAVLSQEGEYSVGGVHIRAISRFHDDANGRKRGKTLVFRFESEGLSVLHLGDIGEPYTPALGELLGRADVLLLPVGGNYTIGAGEAKKYVEGLAPAYVVPMHYHVDGLTVDISGVEPFLSLFGETETAAALEPVRSQTGGTKIVCLERVNHV